MRHESRLDHVQVMVVAEPVADEKTRKKLRSRLDKKRARLQKKALKAADKVFRKKTKQVLAAEVLERGGLRIR